MFYCESAGRNSIAFQNRAEQVLIMERIEKLRLQALEPNVGVEEFLYFFYKRYSDIAETDTAENYASAFSFAFSNLTPSISEGELIVGKRSPLLSPDAISEWQNEYSDIAKAASSNAGGGQDSHMAIDYELVLHCGLNGIIAKIDEYLLHCEKSKAAFYNTCRKCLEAVIKHSESYADYAMTLAEETTDSQRKAELETISKICRTVPANPAGSFYEAVQAVHFISHCLSFNPFRPGWQQFQLGHPDRYLLPYYQRDIDSGLITKEHAQLLLDCIGIQINTRVPNGLSCGYMVGGRDENDDIVANELTEMCMQVVDDIRLVYPSVGLCMSEETDDAYLEKACEILSHGRSHPAIFNDDIITKGLKGYGVPGNEAHSYIHSTCVEITPVASSNAWVASPYTNMPQLLLDSLDREYGSADELLAEIIGKLDSKIKQNFEAENRSRKVRAEHSVNPLLSCFVNDCLPRGTDIEQGGARYNWIMPSFVGVANLVDSFYAVKTVVFEEKALTVKELKAILDCNFEGHEALRLRILNCIPKYGNDIDDIDKYFGIITEHIIAECKKYNGMHTNGKLIPSTFCWIMHERFGRQTGATPDGRRAGFPLGDGSGPCQGREMNGPTASLLSSTKWEHHELIGGVAVNMKFSKKSLGANSVETMKNLIRTYLKRGGFEIQINVIDKATLERAAEHPEEYKDLVVRIGGYSDYFVRLSPGMQQELILRTEHTI